MICDIDIIKHNCSGVWVTPFVEDAEPIKPFAIYHLQLERWLRDNGYLDWEINSSDESGSHLQRTGQIEYMDFVDYELDAKLIHEYMIDKKLTDLKFEQ